MSVKTLPYFNTFIGSSLELTDFFETDFIASYIKIQKSPFPRDSCMSMSCMNGKLLYTHISEFPLLL